MSLGYKPDRGDVPLLVVLAVYLVAVAAVVLALVLGLGPRAAPALPPGGRRKSGTRGMDSAGKLRALVA